MNRELFSRLVNKNRISAPGKRIYLNARGRPSWPAEHPAKEEQGMRGKDQDEVKIIRTACMATNCGTACGILAHVREGVLTKVEPADFPEPGWRYACRRALCNPKIVYHPDRLKHPMKRVGERGEGRWQRISWDEALDTIAGRLKNITAKYGPESVACLMGGLAAPNGGLFSGQRFASTISATWVSPHGATLAGQICADILNFGRRWSVPYLEDHKDHRLYVLWGGNSVLTIPWKYRRYIRPGREKGARMITISPLFTTTAAKSDEWIPIRSGTDTALALGMINLIIKGGLYDQAFLLDHTVGPFLVRSDNGLFLREEPSGNSTGRYMVWDTGTNKPVTFDTPGIKPALRGCYTVKGIECKPAFHLLAESVQKYSLDKVSEITEVAPEAISRLARDYATLKPVISERGVSLQRTFNGDLTYRAINTLAAVTGNICLKRPEHDPFAALNWGPFFFPAGRVCKQLSSFELYENHLTGKPYPIKAFWVSNMNPANAHPNRNNFIELLKSLEFTVVTDIFMSATAEYADILLPGCTPLESTNLALSWWALWGGGHPYFQLQPQVIEPLYECRSDLKIFAGVAERLGFGEFFNRSEEEYIELLLSSGHPSIEGITLEKLREGPVKQRSCSDLLHTFDPTTHKSISQEGLRPEFSLSSVFDTPSGRFEFYIERMKKFGQELPIYIESPESPRQPLAQKYPLSFHQMKSKSRLHAEFAEVDWLREIDPEPRLDMNPADAERRSIKDGDMVTAFNDRGKMKVKVRFNEGIRPGTVCVGEGWQPRHFAEGSYQELTSAVVNPAQQSVFGSIGQMQGVLVEVQKA